MNRKALLLTLFLLWPTILYGGKFDYLISDMPELYDYLNSYKIEHSWGAFAPVKIPEGAISHFNIQFSVENGEVGLDWGLNSPENERILEDFLEAAKVQEIEFELITAPNGFKYYRSTDKKVREFPVKFLTKFYDLDLHDSVHYFSSGF